MNLILSLITPYIVAPIKHLIMNTIVKGLYYLLFHLIWECIIKEILLLGYLAAKFTLLGITTGVIKFLEIPFIHNFISDIFNILYDCGELLETAFSHFISKIKSLSTAIPSEVTIKTSAKGIVSYGEYLLCNFITIGCFSVLGYKMYQNYNEIFELHEKNTKIREALGLKATKIHHPFNLAIYGSISALQIAAIAKIILVTAIPSNSNAKVSALVISGIAELAFQIFKSYSSQSTSELSTCQSTFTIATSRLTNSHQSDIIRLNASISDLTRELSTSKSNNELLSSNNNTILQQKMRLEQQQNTAQVALNLFQNMSTYIATNGCTIEGVRDAFRTTLNTIQQGTQQQYIQ